MKLADIQSFNAWDSFSLRDRHDRLGKLFDNANIGHGLRTNIQIPGRLAHSDDEAVILQRWYARTSVRPDTDHYRNLIAWSHHVVIHIRIDHRIKWQLSLFDLFQRQPQVLSGDLVELSLKRAPCDPWPLPVFGRSNYVEVYVDSYDRNTYDYLEQHEEHVLRDRGGPEGLVWIHFEGVKASSHQTTDLMTYMLQQLAHETKRRDTESELVCQWLMGQMMTAEQDAAHHFSVVRDAIMEGKHRE